MLHFLADWKAKSNVSDTNVDALRLFLESFADWKDPGTPGSTSPADAQTQIDQDLKTHRMKLEAEEKERVMIQTAMKTADETAAKLREEGETIDAIIRKIQAIKDLVTRQARQALAQPAAAATNKTSAAARSRSRPKAGGAPPATPVAGGAPDVAMAAGERYIPPHMRTSSKGRAVPKKRAGAESDEQRGSKYLMLPNED